MNKLPEIPSDFIEPYCQRFLSITIETVAHGKEPAEARADLKGVERFISSFGGIHSRLAVYNEYRKFMELSDKEMVKFCTDAVKEVSREDLDY